MGMRPMVAEYAAQFDVGYDIAVYDHERLIRTDIGHVFDAAAGSEYFRLISDGYRNGIAAAIDEGGNIVMQMVGIYGNLFAAGIDQSLNGDIQHRPAANSKERFGSTFGIRTQPGTEPRSENHGFHCKRLRY